MAVPHEPDYQNYHEAQKSFYTVFTEKGLDSFSSCSDVWAKKGNDIIQVSLVVRLLTVIILVLDVFFTFLFYFFLSLFLYWGGMQVISDALTEKHEILEEMHPEALLYRNLWLKALRALKYKNCALSMKYDGMDGCKSIKK